MLQFLEKEKAFNQKERTMCLIESEEQKRDELEKIIADAFFKRIWAPECVIDKDSWPVIHSEE